VESSEFKDVLRERIEGLVRTRLAEVEAAVAAAQSEVGDLMSRLTHSVSPSSVNFAENPTLDQLSREIHAQVGQAAAESSRLSGDLALLRDSVVDVDSQQTQADVLNVLVDRAASFAPRVILFVIKGQDAIAWAARGFEDEIGDGAVRGLSVTLQSDTVLNSVLKNGSTFLGVPQDQPDNAVLLDRLGTVMPERIAGIPLRVRTKIAAVLYADTYDTSVSSISIEALELLVHSAGIIVELASLRQRLAEVAPPYVPQSVISSASLSGQSYASPYATLTTPRPSFDEPPGEPAYVAEVTSESEPYLAVETAPERVEAEVSSAEPVAEESRPITDELPAPESEPVLEAPSEEVPTPEAEPEPSATPAEVEVVDTVPHEDAPQFEFTSEPASAEPEPDEAPITAATSVVETAEPVDEAAEPSPLLPSADEPPPFTFGSAESEAPAPIAFEPPPWETTQPAGSPIATAEPDRADEGDEAPAAPEPAPFVFSAPDEAPTVEPLIAEPAPFVFSGPADAGGDGTGGVAAAHSVGVGDDLSGGAATEQTGWTESRVERRDPALTWETRAKPPFPGELTEEEEKLHSDARRFARLLVSEIKLYNEHQVVEGRSNNDLYERLKDDIDRSRQMYEKRVAAVVAERFDYFYDELLNTLALGDAPKLGTECPGPTV
jgi:hypothetical protein